MEAIEQIDSFSLAYFKKNQIQKTKFAFRFVCFSHDDRKYINLHISLSIDVALLMICRTSLDDFSCFHHDTFYISRLFFSSPRSHMKKKK